MLYIISESVPFKPNISKLSEKIEVSRPNLIHFLDYLEKAKVLNLLNSAQFGITNLSKPDKVYLNNTNIMYAMSENNANIGNIRETFFYNQLQNKFEVTMPETGDFLVDGKYVFEIGGKNKSNKQVRDIQNSYIAMDDIVTGHANKIPLWLFGFLY